MGDRASGANVFLRCREFLPEVEPIYELVHIHVLRKLLDHFKKLFSGNCHVTASSRTVQRDAHANREKHRSAPGSLLRAGAGCSGPSALFGETDVFFSEAACSDTHFGDFFQRLGNLLCRVLVILEFSVEIEVKRCQVEEPMPAVVDGNDFSAFAFRACQRRVVLSLSGNYGQICQSLFDLVLRVFIIL